jgi:hypothetical protein
VGAGYPTNQHEEEIMTEDPSANLAAVLALRADAPDDDIAVPAGLTWADLRAIQRWITDLHAAVAIAEHQRDDLRDERDRLQERLTQAQDRVWVMPKIEHDDSAAVGPCIRTNGWIGRSEGLSDPSHTRYYAAQLLAAADEAERRTAEAGEAA